MLSQMCSYVSKTIYDEMLNLHKYIGFFVVFFFPLKIKRDREDWEETSILPSPMCSFIMVTIMKTSAEQSCNAVWVKSEIPHDCFLLTSINAFHSVNLAESI